MTHRPVKGMNDILPAEVHRWQRLEDTFRRVVGLHRYREVRLPILEHTSLFVRSIGEATDVVEKEMFTFERSDESLTLRPEGTAGAARAFVSNKVYAQEPVTRWFYIGPMFRAERPQRGRYRQFYQAGCELYGDPGPLADAEMIHMLVTLLRQLGIGELEVAVSSIGGAETRERYRGALLEHLRPRVEQLSDHAKQRLEVNPLRILDSKDPRDKQAVADAPSVLDCLEGDDAAHWAEVQAGLVALGTPFQIDPRLVRGLDYYTRTLFEIRSSMGELGSQNTLLGGGRYDTMIEGLGGPPTPAIGFAMGLERVLLAMPEEPAPPEQLCFIAPLGARARAAALQLADQVRQQGAVVELDGRGGSLKSMLRRADSLGASVVAVLGEAEIDRGVVQLKWLAEHAQEEVAVAQAAPLIANRLGAGRPAGAP